MKVTPIYYNGFVNFVHTPESDEEYAAMVDMAIRSKRAEELQKFIEEVEKELYKQEFIKVLRKETTRKALLHE